MDDGDRVLRSLLAVCERIAQGDYGQVEALFEMTGARAEGATEAALAEAFGNMVVQLEAREYRLNMTIDSLREAQRQLEAAQRQLAAENKQLKIDIQRMQIEIDQTKKEQEVAEITDTDYFQELRQKARQLRDRTKGS
jgi:exonuclease VII small subunit